MPIRSSYITAHARVQLYEHHHEGQCQRSDMRLLLQLYPHSTPRQQLLAPRIALFTATIAVLGEAVQCSGVRPSCGAVQCNGVRPFYGGVQRNAEYDCPIGQCSAVIQCRAIKQYLLSSGVVPCSVRKTLFVFLRTYKRHDYITKQLRCRLTQGSNCA